MVALNLTRLDLLGLLSPSIGRVFTLTDIWLGNNNFSGSIPDLSSLKFLEILHLEDNKFNGEIPLSLGNIQN